MATLHFDDMIGGGELKCNSCGFKKKITVFLHGSMESMDSSNGYQCLKCGNFKTIHMRGSDTKEPNLVCSCGGDLSNEHIVFCPNCKSTDLNYELGIIT
jgi:DNA-directed RNA polymerase subunit RPC12/RpoP